MDVSSAFLSRLLCEDLMLLFLLGGDGFLQLLHVLALLTALAPTSGLQLGWAVQAAPSATLCKVTALFIPHFFFSPPHSSNVG